MIHLKHFVVGIVTVVVGASAAGWAPVSAQEQRSATLTTQDYIDIQQLYATYNRALDLGDGPGRAATFAPDGTFSSALSNHVPEKMDVIIKRTNERGNSGTRHLVTNIIITPTPEGASGFCYLMIVTDNPNPESDIKGRLGFYVDTLVKTPKGWRFKTRETWGDSDPASPYRPKGR